MFVSGNILSFLNQESVVFIVFLKAFISHRLWDQAYEIKTRKTVSDTRKNGSLWDGRVLDLFSSVTDSVTGVCTCLNLTGTPTAASEAGVTAALPQKCKHIKQNTWSWSQNTGPLENLSHAS